MPLPFSTEAMEHLRGADPVMRAIVERVGPLDTEARTRGRPDDSYGALVRSITGQQLSVKAARTIYLRLADLYGGRTPTPAELIATDPDELRAVGLSYQKAAYLRDLAERVEDGELDLEGFPELEDREVSEQLTAVKGVGQWTADVFMMFHLGRPDVLPVGDLGIRKAAEIQHGLRKLPSPDRLKRLARPWRPYRTLACVYLWESLDNAPDQRHPHTDLMIKSSEGPPEGVPSTGIMILNDPDNGRSLVIGLFETEEDLRVGDETLRGMDRPPEAAGDVSSIELYEVAVDRRM